MLSINSLTNDALQQFNLTGIPGIQVGVVLRFMPRTQAWVMDITFGTFIARGIPVICSPNILRQWRDIIPFGLACTDIYFIDPYTINDFANGAATLYLLDSDDVAKVEAEFYP